MWSPLIHRQKPSYPLLNENGQVLDFIVDKDRLNLSRAHAVSATPKMTRLLPAPRSNDAPILFLHINWFVVYGHLVIKNSGRKNG